MNRFVDEKCIKNIQKFINTVGVDVNKYNFRNGVNIRIGKIAIFTLDNKVCLKLDENVDNTYSNFWHKSYAKIIVNDLKQHNTNIYSYIVYDNVYYLLREYTDDLKAEYDIDADIQIIDKKYIVIIPSLTEKFLSSCSDADIEFYTPQDLTCIDDMEDIDDIELNSISLFDETDIFNYD